MKNEQKQNGCMFSIHQKRHLEKTSQTENGVQHQRKHFFDIEIIGEEA